MANVKSKAKQAPVIEGEPMNWDVLTVNGAPVPEHMRHLISYGMTDQGAAEVQAAKADKPKPVVEFLRNGEDSLPQRFEDDLRSGIPIRAQLAREGEDIDLSQFIQIPKEGTVDPLGIEMAKHIKPGQRGLFMSKARLNGADSTRRGVLNYAIVKDEHGKPVEVSGMVLGYVPEAAAKQAENFYREQGVQAQKRAENDLLEQQLEVTNTPEFKKAAGRNGFNDAFRGVERESSDSAALDFTPATGN